MYLDESDSTPLIWKMIISKVGVPFNGLRNAHRNRFYSEPGFHSA